MGNCCNKDKESMANDIGMTSSLHMRHLKPESTPLEVRKISEPQIKFVVSNPGECSDQNQNLDMSAGLPPLRLSHNSSRSSQCSSSSTGTKRKNLTIADFIINRSLGKGAFGQVYLVTRKDTDRKYAMKTISKLDIVKQQLIEATILEKTILLRSTNPFVVSLKYCIQTDKKIYLFMEYISGGEVFTLLRTNGTFPEKVAKFIIAEIILGIQYLHEKLNIIYRDLKPENILLTKSGHIKISDFGLSKEFKNKDDRTYTFAGTPEYLAPEIILNKGHNKNVDLWGIGIFLYELVAGYPPFSDSKRNIEKIQKQIILNKPSFPEKFSPNLKKLILALLQSDPEQRLGANSFQDLKDHPFFYDTEWEKLSNLQIESPLKKFTEQNKPQKVVKQRAIFETPMSSNIQLPQIHGMTYNEEFDQQPLPLLEETEEDEQVLLRYRFNQPQN